VRRTLCAITLVLLWSALVPAASPTRSTVRAPRRISRVPAGSGFQPSLAQKFWRQLNGGLRTMDGPPPPLPTPTPVLDIHGPVPD
jgi:hypothetical protein